MPCTSGKSKLADASLKRTSSPNINFPKDAREMRFAEVSLSTLLEASPVDRRATSIEAWGAGCRIGQREACNLEHVLAIGRRVSACRRILRGCWLSREKAQTAQHAL